MTAIKTKDVLPGTTPSGKTRTFQVTLIKTVDLTVDESVFTQGMLPDNPIFGTAVTLDKVIEHLAFNIAGHGLRLSEIDGYANCPDESAYASGEPWDVEIDCESTPPSGAP